MNEHGTALLKRFMIAVCPYVIAISLSRSALSQNQLVSMVSGPPPHHQTVVTKVRTLIEQSHLLQPRFDDQISGRAFDTFLQRLDPHKLYFLETDYREFQEFRFKIDDELRDGKVTFSYVAYKRFLLRLDQAMTIIEQQIVAPHDFTIQESVSVDFANMRFAADLSEQAERWRKELKRKILELRSEKESKAEWTAQLKQEFNDFYRERSQMTTDELLEMYLRAITNAFDPHTNYRAPLAQETFASQQNLELKGIGTVLRQENGRTLVESIVPGGAADLDGRIQMGDCILAIAQEDSSSPVEILNLKMAEIVGMIRGPVGTKVKITIQSQGTGKIEVFELTRGLITLEDSRAKSEVVELGTKSDNSPYRFGIIQLPSFYRDSEGAANNKPAFLSATRDVKVILDSFNQQNVDAVILDLSRNDNGSLSEAISAVGLFIDEGPVVSLKSINGTLEILKDNDSSVAWSGPLVVMTSQLTTSASEVFAGAIQDYGRGIVVGDPKTHGKGSVQQIVDIVLDASKDAGVPEDNVSTPYGALRITTNQFYLPEGRTTQRVGVLSDLVLPSLSAELPVSESDLEYSLLPDRIQGTPHHAYHMNNEVILTALRSSSQQRIEISSEFALIRSQISSFRKLGNRTSISLDESSYVESQSRIIEKWREMLNDEEKDQRQQVFKNNFYHREILAIARDYVSELAKQSLLNEPAR